jgi:hypothetical protein
VTAKLSGVRSRTRSIDNFVSDKATGDQETAIGIVHQVSTLWTRPSTIEGALPTVAHDDEIGIDISGILPTAGAAGAGEPATSARLVRGPVRQRFVICLRLPLRKDEAWHADGVRWHLFRRLPPTKPYKRQGSDTPK